MRPIRLRLQAFGSYPGTEVVDFDALAPRGLFIVSGDTGSGKSTIFDAMCWALYGRMPGRAPDEVRSHHVGPETPTEVELTFDCEGERYVVTRHPEWHRPARRGSTLVRERAGATLVRLRLDGSTEPIATKVREVTDRCTELIGLEAEQFQRVVLLPQGEFARFLLAGTDEREPLLSQLFGAAVYDEMVKALLAERDRRRDELGEADQRIAEQLHTAHTNLRRAAAVLAFEVPEDLPPTDRDRLGALCDQLDAPLATLRARVADLKQTADTLAGAFATAKDEAERFRQAEELRAELERLERAQARVDADLAAAERSAQARPVVDAAEQVDETRRDADEASAAAEQRREGLRAGFASIGVTVDPSSASVVVAALSDQRARVDRDRAALAAVREARDVLAEASCRRDGLTAQRARCQAELDRCTARQAEIASQLPGLQDQAATLEALAEQLATIDERVAQRRALDAVLVDQQRSAAAETEATQRYDTVLDAFIDTQAPRLAGQLRDGEPCPVCGSTHHPAPATQAAATITTWDEVVEAAEARDAALATLRDLEGRVSELRGALGADADRSVDDLDHTRSDLAERRRLAEQAAAQAGELEAEQRRLATELAELTEELARLDERVRLAEAEVAAAGERLAEAEEAAAGLDPDEVDRQAGVLATLGELCNGLEQCFTRAERTAGLVQRAAQALHEALAASPFPTLDEARAALLTPDDERTRREAKRRHEHRRAEVTGALRALIEQGIPEVCPEVEDLAERSQQAEHAYLGALRDLQTAEDARHYATEALADHDRLVADTESLRRQAEVAEHVHRVCNAGGPGTSMSLTRWVLTRELDRVAAAANVHLQRMTAHRYTLRRKEERDDQRRRFGLDLEVLDAQTGRPRSTSSLSGGEQFQASLALALGLADVVSHGGVSSGRRFEALFVDEGFGSLSAEALDDAVETLVQLQTTGRMVAAITHVEAMKQQLHVGIEVRRRPDGVGSTLVVHP